MTSRLLLLSMACLAAPAWGADPEAPPQPAFTGARVYAPAHAEAYAGVQREIERIEAGSRQTYYVIVVESTGAGAEATRNYLDRLEREWRRQAAAKQIPFDPQRSVVLLLATGTRQLSVHAGEELRERLGLGPEVIQNEIVPAHFLPHARRGEYATALIALLRGLEEYVTAKEAALAPPAPAHAAHPGAQAEAPLAATTEPVAQGRAADEGQSLLVIAALAAVGVAGLAGAGLAGWRLRWKKGVQQRFAAYRERVVQLSDTLDALQERHKLLPYSDPDFAEPMTGQTEALYRAAQEALEEYRQRWLSLMDAWNRAQALIAAESWLGARRYREADRILREAGVEQELQAIRQQCEQPLARLETAHEQAQTDLSAASERAAKLEGRLREIEQAGLSTEPYRPELQAIGALPEEARGLCRSDPIGALERLDKAQGRAAAWERWIDDVLALRRKADEALDRLEQASTAMNLRRNEGFQFCEPKNDPKPLLDEGWERRQAALAALEDGQTQPAAEAVEQAFRAAEEAQAIIEKTVQAKACCEEAFARQAGESHRWEVALRTAQQHCHELEREFASDSWREVAAHVQSAASLLSAADAAMREAASLAAPHVQHYQRAAALVETAQKQRGEAQGLLAALEQRLGELVALRRRCRDEADALRRRLDALADSLRRSAGDRRPSNERCLEAMRRLHEWRAAAERPPADWPALERRLKEITSIAEEAERLAQEDFRLAQQAADALAKAQQELRQAQDFSRMDVRAEVSDGLRLLDDAQRRLHAQDYEEALRLAERAARDARQALADAQRRANEKQAQLDQERRQREARQEAASSPATLGTVATAPRLHSDAPPPEAPPPPEPPKPSSSSQSTWGSNSSQNSW